MAKKTAAVKRGRKAVMTIEVETDLTVQELKDLRALVFCGEKGGDRCTIKHKKPPRLEHTVRGLIKQIQVNVVR